MVLSPSELLFALTLRFLQGLAMCAPTLLIGLFISGVLRAVVGPERIRQQFGGRGAQGLLRASAWATLTPVCSLGVLPIVRELRRAGVPAPPLMTYLFSAPMLNPITLVYGWTILEPPVFFLLVGLTLAVSWGIGLVTNCWAERRWEVDPLDWPQGEWGLRRMANIGIAAARSLAETGWRDLLLALGVGALVAATQPTGWMSPHLGYRNVAAPWVMLISAPLAFIDPYLGVMQVWALASVQFSLAAAAVLHVFGVGCNAAVAAWVARLYGGRRLVSLVLIVLVVTLAAGYAADAMLPHPQGLEEDTHALDVLTRPYEAYAVATSGIGWAKVFELAFRHVHPAFVRSIIGVAALLVVGMALRWLGVGFYSGDVAAAATRAAQASVWGRAIPARWLAVLGLAGLLSLVVLMTYIYYPPASELFEEMRIVRTNAIVAMNLGEFELADRELAKLDGYLVKLPISLALRQAILTEETIEAQTRLRKLISEMRAALARQDNQRAVDYSRQLLDAAAACRKTCLAEAAP